MTKLPASYLFIRNGIYYFQVRIPEKLQRFYNQKNGIFRKSTKTRNRDQANRIARIWWVAIMTRKTLREVLDAIDMEANNRQRMIDHGRQFVAEFRKTGINFNDQYALDDFLQHYSTTDINCFIAAYEYLNSVEPMELVPRGAEPVAAPDSADEILLSEVMEEWVHHNTVTRVGNNAWSLSTQRKFIPQISLFVKMMGDPVVTNITPTQIRNKFAKKLPKIPVRMTANPLFILKKTQNSDGKTEKILRDIDEILEIAESEDVPTIKARTIQDYATNTINFLSWMEREKYVEKGISEILGGLTNIADDEEIIDKAFTDTEIKQIFESKSYINGEFLRQPERYWIPLIAMYTGCRLGEASQLRHDDILLKESILCFNFKTLKQKSKYARRLVPIHKDLIDLGFNKFVSQCKNDTEKWLFPKLIPKTEGDKIGRQITRWFSGERSNGKWRKGYLEQCGIVARQDQRRTFHSFRHYLANRSKQEKDWNYAVWCEITGHSMGRDNARSQYELPFNLERRKQEMDKLSFPFLNVQGIKKWE